MEKNKEIEITMNDNSKKKGEILFTFEIQGDNFVLYSIKNNVFASKINNDGSLNKIEKDEWKIVEKVFDEYMEKNSGDF